jgi:hypothetical protein
MQETSRGSIKSNRMSLTWQEVGKAEREIYERVYNILTLVLRDSWRINLTIKRL